MKRAPTIAAVFVVVAATASAVYFLANPGRETQSGAFTAPGLEPLTMESAQAEFWRLTPALLLVV